MSFAPFMKMNVLSSKQLKKTNYSPDIYAFCNISSMACIHQDYMEYLIKNQYLWKSSENT
jgi:hypothetical protein